MADERGNGGYDDDDEDSDGDGRKVTTDPHFHGGTTAPASTETPAPTTPSSCGSWASASCQSAETCRPPGWRHLGMTREGRGETRRDGVRGREKKQPLTFRA